MVNNKDNHLLLQQSRVKRTLKLYAKMLLNNDIDYFKLRNVYNRAIPDEKAEQYIKKIVRLKESQKLIESEVLAEYELQGITAKTVIKDESDLLNLAFNTNDLSSATKIVHKWGARIGLDPVTIKQSISITAKTTDYKALLDSKQPPKQIEESNEE